MSGLLVNVAQLLKEDVGSTRVHMLDVPWAAREDEAPRSHARGRLTLTRTDRGIWVSGAVEIGLEAVCGRCTVPFCTFLRVQLDEVYLPAVDLVTGGRMEYTEEERESFRIDPHHTLDLTEAVRQYGIAASPMAALCREDCLGLCPRCGADLNDGPCGCQPTVDARWGRLKELFADVPRPA